MARSCIKFLYSYGGRIAPLPTNGVLYYFGGNTKVLSVDRSISFAELMVKLAESCGCFMDLKCKLPTEDLDMLVTIKSDEDLQNVLEEYEMVSPDAKIRAMLFPIKSKKGGVSPMSCFDFPSPKKPPRVPVRSPAPSLASTPRVPVGSPAPSLPSPPRVPVSSPAPSPPSSYAVLPCAAASHCSPPAVEYPSPRHMQYVPVPQWSYQQHVPVPVPVPQWSYQQHVPVPQSSVTLAFTIIGSR